MNGLIPGLLSPEQQAMAEERARQSSLLNLGFALLQSSQGQPGQPRPRLGQIIGQAGPQAVQAYQSSFDDTLKQLLTAQQMRDAQRKREQEESALARQTRIQEAMSLPTTREQVDALRGLGAYQELSALANAEKILRQSGVMRQQGEVTEVNPFAVYQQSNIPGVKKLADQLGKAYDQGTIDEEKATQRLGELARMEEAALAREESQQERRLTREQMSIDRQITREGQAAEREAKRLEGTEGQRLSAGFAARMDAANAIIQQLEPAGGLPSLTTEIAASIPFVGNYAQRKVMSAEQQKYKQAADNWIRANLRKESGAVIGEEEMAAEYRTYFPQPGDTPEVIAQKAQARELTSQAMRQNAGPVYRPTQGPTRPSTQQPQPAAQPPQGRRPLGSIFGQ